VDGGRRHSEGGRIEAPPIVITGLSR
jgi:hypothetical protein